MADAAAPPPLPTPAQLRWVLVAYGTACFVPACVILTLLTSGGRQMGTVFLHFLALPDPFPVLIGYGLGYLIVQYRIRNRRPSFLQSQVFAASVFLGMFVAFALCSLVFGYGPLSHASGAAVTAVLLPLKLGLGGATGAWIYPWLARRRVSSSRYYSPTPILPKYASPPGGEKPEDSTETVGTAVAPRPRPRPRSGGRARSRRR